MAALALGVAQTQTLHIFCKALALTLVICSHLSRSKPLVNPCRPKVKSRTTWNKTSALQTAPRPMPRLAMNNSRERKMAMLAAYALGRDHGGKDE